MNFLDLYLQRNNSKRYEVHKKTGISQQLLSTHTKKKVENYSTKVITAIGETLGKSPGQVLDELLTLEKENPAFEVFNPNELMIALKGKEDTIIISGAYCEKIYTIMRGHLSENEMLGFELGSRGTITVLAYAIEAVRDLFTNDSNESKIEKDIEKKLRLYKIKEIGINKLVLTLRQLDY